MARAPTLQPNGEGDSLPWSHPGATLEPTKGQGRPPGALTGEDAYPAPTLYLPYTYPGADERAERQRRPPRGSAEDDHYPAPTLELP
jgi:hypothetical protein